MKNELNNITEEQMSEATKIIDLLSNYFDERIVGQQNLKKALLVSFMANGHILLESVPGLAKTTAAKILTDALNGKFAKIQCTPDLLPSDIIGTQIFNYKTGKFEVKVGPVYANFVLLDEINRSSAKTQSAMLEAMQERQISIDRVTLPMPNVFVVIATQNPIEQEGTYLLAEAQLDRFLIKEKIDYPTIEEEIEILNREENNVFVKNAPIFKIEDIEFLQNLSRRVYIDNAIKEYIAKIINATRNSEGVISKEMSGYIRMGASPRGSIAFMKVAKALALINGRNYVIPEDIKEASYSVLRHRIELNYSAVADGVEVEKIIDEIVGAIQTP
jgi:MoxR-like ATPase